jgi:flavodoxin
MKIGIIIHSHTGNTLSVAEKIKAALEAKGHVAKIDRVEAVNEDPAAVANLSLKSIPDTGDYDFVVFGAPVRAFSLSPAMKLYLKTYAALDGKKVNCFVTQQLPMSWMGGSRALKQMTDACKARGASVFETGIVNWSAKSKDKQITDFLERLNNI